MPAKIFKRPAAVSTDLFTPAALTTVDVMKFNFLLCYALLALYAPFAHSLESRTLLVVGDSISAGYGIQREEGWVSLLSQALLEREEPWRVINASISGETTGGGLARLPALLREHTPALVIIELGGNDGLRGYPIGKMRENLSAMVQQVQQQQAVALLVAMRIPPNYGPRYTDAFERVYADVAAHLDAALVPFLLDRVALEDGLMQADGIHPTAAAQPLLLEAVWTYLEPLLVVEESAGDGE